MNEICQLGWKFIIGIKYPITSLSFSDVIFIIISWKKKEKVSFANLVTARRIIKNSLF